jgi:hypothetical protein
MRRLTSGLLALLLLPPLCASAHVHDAVPPSQIDCTSANPVVWLPRNPAKSLVHWKVADATVNAQRCIDHGVASLYGFSVAQARDDFARANAIQKKATGNELALAYWGIAESWTIDINLPSSTAQNEQAAADAAKHALDLANATTDGDPETLALANAIVKRFPGAPASPSPAVSECDIHQQFRDYALTLQDYVSHNRGTATANIYTVAGFAWYTMEQNPVLLCQTAKKRSTVALTFAGIDDVTPIAPLCPPPYPDVAIQDADFGIKRDASNPGPYHLGVHARETCGLGGQPAAKRDADMLTSYRYAPGMSHLPHMASHIYSRLGLYRGLAQSIIHANLTAVDNDHAYYRQTPSGDNQLYLNRYHTHDIDFLLYAWTTIGHNASAQRFVQEHYPNGRPLLSLRLRLHQALPSPHPDDSIREPWREVLASLSAARQGDYALAHQLASAQEAALIDLVNAQILLHKRDVAVAAHERERDLTLASGYYKLAYCEKYVNVGVTPPTPPPHKDCVISAAPVPCPPVEPSPGDPKDYWMVPIGEGYGKTLLQLGQYKAAADVFRNELCRFPNDPHLEWGAAQAYRLMHDAENAQNYMRLYRIHWKNAAGLTLDQLG